MERAKTVLISGAYLPGIGETIRTEFLNMGWNVIALYEQAEKDKVVDGIEGILPLLVDLTSSQSIEQAMSKLPKELNAYVHATMYFDMKVGFDQELWSNTFQVNVVSAAQIVEAIRPKFISGGSIVAISSTEAFMGSYGSPAYSSSRAAMHNLVKSWANKYGGAGIRANAIAAGWIGGVMDTDEVFNKSRKITPLGRLGSPKEIAATVRFLCSDESSFINGSVITADGGYSGVDTVSKFEYQNYIAKNDFETFTSEFITQRACQGDEFWAVSKMFDNEWEDTEEIRQFMKDQINAVKRGAVVNRIFILPDCKYSNDEMVFKFHIENEGINGYVVDYNSLKDNEPELFDMFGDGVTALNEELLIFDKTGDDKSARGVLVTDGRQVSALKFGFEKLLKLAKKID
jgi:NAD(P)-dependent dehydrogenase (short-subunit alcohol dehydrogenase family)